MSSLRSWLVRLAGVFLKKSREAEVAQEMQAHLDGLADRNMANGMAPEEAGYAAQRQFGGTAQLQEECRDVRGFVWLEQSVKDVRFAMRSLARSPDYSIPVIGILALSIGLVTAITDTTRRVLLPAVPFRDSSRLVVLRELLPHGRGYMALWPFRFTSYARHERSFAAFGAETSAAMNLVVREVPYTVNVACVTNGFFRALSVACRRGRVFVSSEYRPGATATVVVLGHRAWAKYFESDPGLLGHEILLGGQLRRVVGILPAGVRLPPGFRDDGVYLPTVLPASPEGLKVWRPVQAVGRLRTKVTMAHAQADLRTIKPPAPPGSALAEVKPFLFPLADIYRAQGERAFEVFLGAAFSLYLIGGTAVANLMLARSVRRRREFGVRLALGAGSARVVSLISVESAMLGLLGATGGVLVAWWLESALRQILPAGIASSGGLAWQIAGIAASLGLATCVPAGCVSVWQVSRVNLSEAMKEGAGTLGDSRRLRRWRGGLVVVQGALATVLLIGAGLLIRTVYRLQHADLGFSAANKVAVTGYHQGPIKHEHLRTLKTEILARLASLPGVAGAAVTTTIPLIGTGFVGTIGIFKVKGAGGETIPSYEFAVSPNFFRTIGARLVTGTGFDGLRPGDRPVAVIDGATAQRYFPGENAVGHFLTLGGKRLEIVGVVHALSLGFRGYYNAYFGNRAVSAQVYIPMWQSHPNPYLNAVLDLKVGAGAGLSTAVHRAVYEVDPSMVISLWPFKQFLSTATATDRHARLMLGVLSALALALAAFGLFSVTAYAVEQRKGELAVRQVLGATPRRVLAAVLGRGLLLAATGLGIGIGLALGLTCLLRGLLYHTNPSDPVTFAGVAGILITAALLACWLPARKAARVDAAQLLRAE